MKTLQIIVSAPKLLNVADASNFQETRNKAEKEGHKVAFIGYLHGELEFAMKYDLGICLNAEECIDEATEFYIPGIYNAVVNDYPIKCKAFLWNAGNRPRGLIIDPTNLEDLEYAEECYNKRVANL